ncbi:pemK-like family protein [Rickettsia rhipicephali str. Ect]|nr:pemK-like family protein [Rickettsia rhipicephali str. Ect]
MVDKISAIRSDKIQKKIGELSPEQLEELIEAIKSWMN